MAWLAVLTVRMYVLCMYVRSKYLLSVSSTLLYLPIEDVGDRTISYMHLDRYCRHCTRYALSVLGAECDREDSIFCRTDCHDSRRTY